ncbi:thioredoxin [Rhodobacteraceae bacterium RKSG542]|uniref:thioredoxin n=1 Tax=Pseudovibrio flavus TaxID=2529854 RepID=UPI0012BC77D2|nr:thioredoxin [Pseudovibrio flavus]MTI18323.1 thioredoxin [Pseudovibrio flavus]
MSGSGFSVGGSFGGTMGGSFGGGYQTEPAQSSAGGHVFDTTTQTFMQDVIDASRNQPILVDFWAPWCEPCKQLTPILEKVVGEAKGAVKLAKMNIEDYPEVAGQMGVQSIPAVVAFKNGQPVDGFMGALPEGQIKQFLERLGVKIGPSDAEKYIEQGDALRAEGDYPQAAQLYGAVLSIEPHNTAAIAGLAHCYLAADDVERAKQALDMAPADAANAQEIVAARAAIELAEQAASVDDLAGLKERVSANPDDHEARFDLAVGLSGRGEKNEAVDQLIEIIRRDREWREDGARTQLLQFFEAWGFKDPASAISRRKLSSILFS